MSMAGKAWLDRQRSVEQAYSKSARWYSQTFLRALRKGGGDGLLRHKEMVEWSESATGGKMVYEELTRPSDR